MRLRESQIDQVCPNILDRIPLCSHAIDKVSLKLIHGFKSGPAWLPLQHGVTLLSLIQVVPIPAWVHDEVILILIALLIYKIIRLTCTEVACPSSIVVSKARSVWPLQFPPASIRRAVDIKGSEPGFFTLQKAGNEGVFCRIINGN